MSVKIEYKNEAMEPGTELFVTGLGKLVNGKEVSFSSEEVDSFEAMEGRKIGEAFKANPHVKVSRSKEGGN